MLSTNVEQTISVYRTNKTNTSKQVLVSCLHIYRLTICEMLKNYLIKSFICSNGMLSDIQKCHVGHIILLLKRITRSLNIIVNNK